MAVLKCKMCGGTIEFKEGATVGVCESCGTKQTFPRLDDERKANLYDRANHFRRNNEFDKAAAIYEQILNEDTTDAEAYWSLVLCNYGIEYVEDPSTKRRVPTVNRAQFTSIFDDDNYKSAIKHADSAQRELYEDEAKAINDIQKGILAISQKEEPFDVFICYKETDNNGRRTPDSVLANDLYHQLVQEGFKVFFARITLEDKLGTAYEPYIFAALNSAKVMVVLGTKAEYFNAVWVKNEWSRYLALVKKSGGKKILIPAYKDMDPYDLPEEFSHLQAQDMSKLGFMQDLIRGIKKIAKIDTPKTTIKETVVVGSDNKNVAPLLERAFLFLEDGKWQDASIYCEKVLDIDPKNAEAYLGKLMSELQVKSRKELANLAEPFDNNENYAKVLRFADEKLEEEVRVYITYINERNENERLSNIYDSAIRDMNVAATEEQCKMAAEKFKTISGFKDADDLALKCIDNAEICRKDKIYYDAITLITGDFVTIRNYELALVSLKKISGWKDTDEQISNCQKKIEDLKVVEEKRNYNLKHLKKILILAASIIIVIIVAIFAFESNKKYNEAISLINSGDYDVAYSLLAEIGKYGIIKSNKYERALQYIDMKEYGKASLLLKGINYKDSESKLNLLIEQHPIVSILLAEVGTNVDFGSYEQVDYMSGYKYPIEWIVLDKNKITGEVLLLSEYNLWLSGGGNIITWETSGIRSYLNGDFYDEAFSDIEKQYIQSKYIINEGENNTNDKIFLLSLDEANKYFKSDMERKTKPTSYATRYLSPYKLKRTQDETNNSCSFWLRSPGYNGNYRSCVMYDGSVSEFGSIRDKIGIRPALWVKCN